MVRGKPAEKRMTVFRPGTVCKFLANPRRANSMVRAPKFAMEPGRLGAPIDATWVGSWPPESTAENFTLPTTCFNLSALEVKFCAMCREPPKSTIAIKCSSETFLSINFPAACRA
jgi:hypothetical protein